jgi:cellobiose-specific phosphotransferase system component IIC
VTLFVTAIQNPVIFAIAGLLAGAFVLIFLRAAMSPERRTGSIGWVRSITGPNAKVFFGVLALVWAVVFGFLIQSFPNTAGSPYGAVALIALFSGFFIMIGMLWAVIGE